MYTREQLETASYFMRDAGPMAIDAVGATRFIPLMEQRMSVQEAEQNLAYLAQFCDDRPLLSTVCDDEFFGYTDDELTALEAFDMVVETPAHVWGDNMNHSVHA